MKEQIMNWIEDHKVLIEVVGITAIGTAISVSSFVLAKKKYMNSWVTGNNSGINKGGTTVFMSTPADTSVQLFDGMDANNKQVAHMIVDSNYDFTGDLYFVDVDNPNMMVKAICEVAKTR